MQATENRVVVPPTPTGCALHEDPFHVAKTGDGVPLPTAAQKDGLAHETLWPRPSATSTFDHVAPSHRSTSVPAAGGVLWPTAQHSEASTQDTLCS
ncbi:MAG TPA: hypothetical protein VFA70_11820 [Dehalococcoidia bacterium]|nr:hypothetical protein [Dehalococcoidia bacterium]